MDLFKLLGGVLPLSTQRPPADDAGVLAFDREVTRPIDQHVDACTWALAADDTVQGLLPYDLLCDEPDLVGADKGTDPIFVVSYEVRLRLWLVYGEAFSFKRSRLRGHDSSKPMETGILLSGLCTIATWRGHNSYTARCRNGSTTKANEEKEERLGEGGYPPLRPGGVDYELYESKWRKVECNAELDIQEVVLFYPPDHPGSLRAFLVTLRHQHAEDCVLDHECLACSPNSAYQDTRDIEQKPKYIRPAMNIAARGIADYLSEGLSDRKHLAVSIRKEFMRVASTLKWTLHPQLKTVTHPDRCEIESVVVSAKVKTTIDKVTINDSNHKELTREIEELTDRQVHGAIAGDLQARWAL